MVQNAKILAMALGDDYSDRIPSVTQSNLADVATAIMTYQPAKNAVLDALYNKIALTLINSMEFTNPFSRFRRSEINYGDTIEDIFVDIPEGYEYDNANTDPFGQTVPTVKALYSTINKQMQYKQTIHDAEFRKALRQPYGLDTLVTRIVNTLRTAAEYDDYLIGKQLLAQDGVYGEVVKIGVETGVASTDAKTLLDNIKQYGSALKFPSSNYNKAGIKNVTPMKRQVLVIRASLKNQIDLDVLAGLYNLSKADITQSIIEVDDFNGDSTMAAALIDERFINIYPALQDGGLIYNPQGLYTNHFWNTWSVNTVSLFQNAICFKFEAAGA